MTGAPVRVLVVDDQPHFRRGVRAAVEASGANIEVVGEAGDGDEAIEQARALHPDVVLLDVRMPGTDGIKAARAITAFLPDTKILMLTISDLPDDIAMASRAGAAGYLLKERSLHEVVEAVLALAGGQRWPLAAG